MRLWIRNLDQLVQVCANQELVKRGPAQDRLAVLNRTEAGDGCSLIIGSDGRIRFVGHDADVPDHLRRADRTIEASGCSVIPGLVDAHTHPVWAGDRSFEFDLKARGELLCVSNDTETFCVITRETFRIVCEHYSIRYTLNFALGLGFDCKCKKRTATKAKKKKKEKKKSPNSKIEFNQINGCFCSIHL